MKRDGLVKLFLLQVAGFGILSFQSLIGPNDHDRGRNELIKLVKIGSKIINYYIEDPLSRMRLLDKTFGLK